MPTAKKKISTLGQVVFIAFAIIVDIIELILDLIPIVGIIANRIIDIIVAGIFFLYAYSKGLTVAEDSKVYASIAGTIVGEFIPMIDVAPFFSIDAWYITHSIKMKDKANQKKLDEETQIITAEQDRQEWIKNYEQQQALQMQEENEQVEEQEEPPQETNEQDTYQTSVSGVGRIKPLQTKGSSTKE